MNKFSQNLSESQKLLQSSLRAFRSSCKVLSATSEALAKSSPRLQKVLQSPLHDFRSSSKVLSATSEALAKSSPRLQKVLQSPLRDFRSSSEILSGLREALARCSRVVQNPSQNVFATAEAPAKSSRDFKSFCKVDSGLSSVGRLTFIAMQAKGSIFERPRRHLFSQGGWAHLE